MMSLIGSRRGQAAVCLVVALLAWWGPIVAPLPIAPEFVDAIAFTGKMLAVTCAGAGLGCLFGYGWCGAALAIAPTLVGLLVMSLL